MAPLAQRLASAKATAQHPDITVTAIETELGTRYTVDTIKALQQCFPRARFVWLMGADNMQQVTRWRHWPELFGRIPVAVFRRPAYAAGRGCGKAAQCFAPAWHPISRGRQLAAMSAPAWLVLDNPLNAFSATKIRKDLATWPK
jgi:nicotinate-nucleotide adenylyltransferase